MGLSAPLQVVRITLDRPGRPSIDLTKNAESLRFTTTAPGGYGSCSMTVAGLRVPDMPPLSILRVSVSGSTIWEGQVEDTGSTTTTSSQTVKISAFGRARELDETSVRQIWVRRQWDWTPIVLAAGTDTGATTLGKRADLYQVNTGQFDPTNTALNGVEVRGAQNSGTAADGDYHGAQITAPDGVTINRFVCEFDINGSNHQGVIQSSADGSSWTTHSCPTSDGLVDVTLVTGARHVRVGLAASASQAITTTIYGRFTNIRVLGTTLTDDDAGGFYISTILRDIISLAPRLTVGRIDTVADNLVTNRSVEQNIDGWISENAVTVARTTGQQKFGNASCEATVSSGASAPQVGIRTTSGSRIPVNEGVVYTASVYVKTRASYAARNASLRVLFYDSGGSEVAGGSQTGNTPLTTSYQRIQHTWAAVPATAVTARVIVYLHNSGATVSDIFDLDGAQIVAGTAPADWPFTVDQLDRSQRSSLRSVVDEVARYSTNEWAVWDDGEFDWIPVDYDAPGWLVTTGQCLEIDTAASVDGMARTVYLSYQDAKTSTTREVSAASTDQRNPYVRQGRTRDLLINAPAPMTDTAAQELADNIAAFAGTFPPVRGRIVLGLERIVRREGGSDQPAYAIRAGDNISITDIPKTGDVFQQGRDSETLFHIVGTDVDSRAGRITLEIENQQTRRLDVLLARLAAASA